MKQAGELSGDKVNTNVSIGFGAAGTSNGSSNINTAPQTSVTTATTSGVNLPDIPIVSEPEYPERGGSMFSRTHQSGKNFITQPPNRKDFYSPPTSQEMLMQLGTNERSKLAVAPMLDVSSSGADDSHFSTILFFLKQTTIKTKNKLKNPKKKNLFSSARV